MIRPVDHHVRQDVEHGMVPPVPRYTIPAVASTRGRATTAWLRPFF
jgi:hypothetical protein